MCLTLLKIYVCFISSLNKLSKIVLIKADVLTKMFIRPRQKSSKIPYSAFKF